MNIKGVRKQGSGSTEATFTSGLSDAHAGHTIIQIRSY